MTDARCIADREDSQICGEPATVLDPQRGEMVYAAHAPPQVLKVCVKDEVPLSLLEQLNLEGEEAGIVRGVRRVVEWLRHGRRQTLSSASDLLADGSVKDTLQGETHKGEENTENIARTLIARLNQDGAHYGEPKKLATEQGVDWVAYDGREKLSIQVTRIGDEKFFEKLSQLREQAQLGGTDEAADRLLAAITPKAKQIPPTQRAELTLALDAIVLPSHTLEPVIDAFRSRYGAWARQLGFKAIWLVGGSPRLTNRLDPPLW